MDCARLVNNEGLPPHVMLPTILLALIFGVITLFKTLDAPYAHLLPSGLAAAVGILSVTPLAYGKECTTLRRLLWLELLVVLHRGGGFDGAIGGAKRRKRFSL